MEPLDSRKGLLVFGWVRNNYVADIPDELTKFIQSFSYDVVQCTLEDERFQRVFGTFYSPSSLKWVYAHYNDCSVVPMNIQVELVDGFKFVLSVSGKNNSEREFVLKIDQLSLTKDFVTMKGMIKYQGNTHPKQSILKFTYDDFAIKILSISADENITDNYNKFDMLFHIEIIDVKYHKMKIQQKLQWELDEEDLNDLKDEYAFICRDINDWRICCKGYGGPMMKQAMIIPLTLPRNVVAMRLEFNWELNGDDGKVIKKSDGFSNVSKTGGYIVTWNHSEFVDCHKLEIILDVKIIYIACIGGKCNKDSWIEYGFYD